jgi:ElaB/YqjD/DUF883 family membrane-anchored ribosome-binding protein
MNPNRNGIEKTAADTASSAVATGAVAQASGSAHHAIDRAADAARPAVDQIASGAHAAVDSLAGAAISAADGIAQRSDQMHGFQQQLTASCRGYMRDQPLASLGLAVAAGFALSWVIRQR